MCSCAHRFFTMGSKRKRTEKKKDFHKTKLKVGKTAAKPANYTDTSFRSKTISLPNQGLAKRQEDLTHQLALTKHHSSSTRKEVLGYIATHLPSNPAAYKDIIGSITPLITDQSNGVRTEAVALLKACALAQPGLLELHIRLLALFVHSSMSHIVPEVRNSSTKFLEVLIAHASQPLIASYFTKTLKSFFTLMAWTLVLDKKAVLMAITTSVAVGGSAKKARIGHLAVLRQLLEVALFAPEVAESTAAEPVSVIHPDSLRNMVPLVPSTYAPLKLFVQEMKKTPGGSNDDGTFTLESIDDVNTDDIDTRVKVVRDVFHEPLVRNLNNLVKEGGDVGREANSCLAVLARL